MANPDFGSMNRFGTVADQASFDVGLRTHMIRVYNYMASGLALSGIVAFALYNFEGLQSIFFQVGTREADDLLGLAQRDLHLPAEHDGQLVLTDLVAFRKVRIEIVLPREDGTPADGSPNR